MKIVKYIFLLLLLAAIAVTVFIATQEGKYNIKKDKVISVPRTLLYNYINDYKNWENLDLLASADTTAAFTYSENAVGKGAFMSWVKDKNTGRVQTINIAANDSISQKADINDLESDILWSFKDTLNSTKVSVRLKGKLTFSEKAAALLNGGMDNQIESSLEKGLDNLNNFLVKEIKVYTIDVAGIVSKNGTYYLGQKATSSPEDVNVKATATFDKLIAFAKENNITVTGRPFIIYKGSTKGKENITYTYSIPIKDEMFTSPGSDYEGGKLTSFNALKTTLKGDYSHLPKAWQAAAKHINEKALQENTTGQYVEVYTKNVHQSRRPSAWMTDLYIPIGPESAPAIDSTAIVPATAPANGSVKPAVPVRRPATATGTTTPAKPASTTTKPAGTGSNQASTSTTTAAKPAGTRAATTTPKPAGITTKPATSTATTPASASRAAGTTTKTTTPATSTKPSTTGTTKPASNSTSTATKPATSTSKPATTTTKPATSTTKPATTKPRTPTTSGKDDLNPPRAEK